MYFCEEALVVQDTKTLLWQIEKHENDYIATLSNPTRDGKGNDKYKNVGGYSNHERHGMNQASHVRESPELI